METDIVAEPRDSADHDPPADLPFETFYAVSVDRVHRALAVTLGDAHLAREATDEAMARAFVKWRQVSRCDNPGGWVFRVGLNRATSWRRKLRRDRFLPDSERGMPAVQAPRPDGDAVAALALLPVAARAVVVCRVLFGLSTADTAAVLRVAEGTVRSRLSPAMTVLRAELRDDDSRIGGDRCSSATNRPDLDLPADVGDAVRTTAAHVPALPQDLARVRARARTFRRRRRALSAAATAVAVLAAGAAVPVLRSVTSHQDTVAGDPYGRHPIALWLNRDEPPATRGVPPGRHVPGSSGEIAAHLRTVNGEPTITPVGPQPGLGEGTYLGPAPLPGGGLATIGSPPPNGQDAPQAYQVVVVDADGRTVASRPLPQMRSSANRPMPMTGSGTTLFWWQIRRTGETARPVLLTYDIAAGTLRELTPASAPTGYELPYFGMHATAERIIEWPARFGQTCSAEVLDARTGERVALLRPAITGCTDAHFALSPDDKRVAALVTYRDAHTWRQRVITIDPVTGDIDKDFRMPPLATGTDRTRLVYGIDWADATTLRYARGLLPGVGRAAPDPVVLTLKL